MRRGLSGFIVIGWTLVAFLVGMIHQVGQHKAWLAPLVYAPVQLWLGHSSLWPWSRAL